MNVSAGAKVLEAALAEKKAFVLDRLANYRKASHFTFRKNRALGVKAAQNGSWPTPLRDWGMWRGFQRYFNAQLHKTTDLDPSKTYLFGYHPHGIMPAAAWLTFGTNATGFSKAFPGIVPVRMLTLGFNFRIPILREYLLLHGVCDVSRWSCINLLRSGTSIAIAIGGGSESLYCAPGTHEIILKRRKGFIKVALQTGASLVPVYSFGETDCFNTLNRLPFNSPVRRFQRKMEKAWGWTWPIGWGTGVFLPIGILPYPADLNTVVGAPIDVPRFEGDLNSAEFRALVDKYHQVYTEALLALFKEHKGKFAPSEGDLTVVE
ncbi:hypothetical protein N2152v2_004406 [Parachlorella kessleri]